MAVAFHTAGLFNRVQLSTHKSRYASFKLPPTDRDELNRLHLGIARAQERRSSLKVLLANVDADIADRRNELLNATARVTRVATAMALNECSCVRRKVDRTCDDRQKGKNLVQTETYPDQSRLVHLAMLSDTQSGKTAAFAADDACPVAARLVLQRILYIEDDEDIAAIAGLTLEVIGKFDVHHFSSGAAAIAAYGEVEPHLILVDVMMPQLDGPATMTQLMKAHGAACTPFIFMTARAQLHEQAHYRALGALDVIVKPFDPMTLCQKIQEIWDQKHAV